MRMANNQAGSTLVNAADPAALPNWGQGGWSPGVQMPSGGLLDPSGQNQTQSFQPAATYPSFALAGGDVGSVDWSAGSSRPITNQKPDEPNDDYNFDDGFAGSTGEDQPFQVAGDNLPYATMFGPPKITTRRLQDRLNDPNIDKLKDDYGNTRGTQYLSEEQNHNYGWEILGDLVNLGVSAFASRFDPELSLDASEKLGLDESASRPTEAYNRLDHYGRSPTGADRAAIGAGSNQVVDHQPPLSKRWYFGDPSRGEIPGFLMTPSQRAASAADRSRMSVQSQRDSNIQGGEMSVFARRMKRIYGF